MNLILAQVVYKPCEGVDPNSWEWIYKGCWLFQSHTVIEIGASITLALLVAVMLRSLRQERTA